MSNHFLKRNPNNEPVCSCGYRPEILDDPAPVGQQWKAQTAVLDHIDAEEAACQGTAFARRSPEDPFRAGDEVKYPRAGVRQTKDGRWLLTLWDGDQIVHVIDKDDRVHADRYTAFTQGWLTVGACRQSGTNLNGLAVA